jgi:hypothetical protein
MNLGFLVAQSTKRIDDIEENGRHMLWPSFNLRIIASLRLWALFGADFIGTCTVLGPSDWVLVNRELKNQRTRELPRSSSYAYK